MTAQPEPPAESEPSSLIRLVWPADDWKLIARALRVVATRGRCKPGTPEALVALAEQIELRLDTHAAFVRNAKTSRQHRRRVAQRKATADGDAAPEGDANGG